MTRREILHSAFEAAVIVGLAVTVVAYFRMLDNSTRMDAFENRLSAIESWQEKVLASEVRALLRRIEALESR